MITTNLPIKKEAVAADVRIGGLGELPHKTGSFSRNADSADGDIGGYH